MKNNNLGFFKTSPKIWERENLPKYLAIRFFLGLSAFGILFGGIILLLLMIFSRVVLGIRSKDIPALIGLIYIFVFTAIILSVYLVLIVISLVKYTGYKKGGDHEDISDYKLHYNIINFGVNDASVYDVGKSYKIAYCVVFIPISTIAYLFFIFTMNLIKTGWSWLIIGSILYSVLSFSLFQIYSIVDFKNRIRKYGCSKCGYVNIWEEIEGELNVYYAKGTKVVQEGCTYEEEIGYTYVNDEKVPVYQTNSTPSIYQNYECKHWDVVCVCKQCGHKITVHRTTGNYNIGDAYQK